MLDNINSSDYLANFLKSIEVPVPYHCAGGYGTIEECAEPPPSVMI